MNKLPADFILRPQVKISYLKCLKCETEIQTCAPDRKAHPLCPTHIAEFHKFAYRNQELQLSRASLINNFVGNRK